jgi:hypothetical protein
LRKAARELRDRYLEHLNQVGDASALPQGKYDVGRALPDAGAVAPALVSSSRRMLPAA